MAATTSKMAAQKLLGFGLNALSINPVNSCIRKALPCCSYATFAGKAASGMMKQNTGSSYNPKNRNRQGRGAQQSRKTVINPSRSLKMVPETTDWPSVFSGAQTFNPSVIPVFLRMGRPKHNRIDKMPNRTMGNIELMKVPNFFHLSPPAIQRHCDAIKHLCKPWPDDLSPSLQPLRITTRNYLFAGPSLHHPGSRKVILQICLKDLVLDEHARNKLIELVGPRYDMDTDTLTIITNKCPTRKQNKGYALYLLTVLYHEAWKKELWEAEVVANSEQEEAEVPKTKRRNPKRLRLVGDELFRFNQYGKGFKLDVKTKVE